METIRISAKSIIKGEVAICLLLLFLYGYRQAGNVIRTMSQVTEVHKIAITFDDDVIIGLSQEISYKEEVSMI